MTVEEIQKRAEFASWKFEAAEQIRVILDRLQGEYGSDDGWEEIEAEVLALVSDDDE